MFGLGPATRVYVGLEAVDMRKGFEGLYGVVRDYLGQDPLSGHLLSQSGRVKTLAFQATASARAPQVTVEGWQNTGAARTPYWIFICMWC
ncbi:MAG: IS66 family insertion sequence element accessory protein TnpB, partial [Bryobacterales bacterium]|nr:IS66 family insertion sequence element accessory protein TnpB [Bryobacterales bacterium]